MKEIFLERCVIFPAPDTLRKAISLYLNSVLRWCDRKDYRGQVLLLAGQRIYRYQCFRTSGRYRSAGGLRLQEMEAVRFADHTRFQAVLSDQLRNADRHDMIFFLPSLIGSLFLLAIKDQLSAILVLFYHN